MDVQIPCSCPGTPHEQDTVTLRDKLGLAAGIAIQQLIIGATSAETKLDGADIVGVLSEAYLLLGVSGWSCVDAVGKPLAVTPENIRIRLLDDFTIALPVAEAADTLYMEAVLSPLVKKASALLPSTPTNGSTSAQPSNHRKRSRRSSTTASPMAGTEPILASPDGVSNS